MRALFSNSWICYYYDDLSRLNKREVGGILEEHYTCLAGSETGTTTTLPETYDITLKGSSTKLSGYRYAYDERNHTIEGESVSTFALNGFGVVTGAALFVKEEYDLLAGGYNQYQVTTGATYLKSTEISGVYAKFTVLIT